MIKSCPPKLKTQINIIIRAIHSPGMKLLTRSNREEKEKVLKPRIYTERKEQNLTVVVLLIVLIRYIDGKINKESMHQIDTS